MKIISEITEHEMVAHFLQTEIESDRFKGQIFDLLEQEKLEDNIIRNPDVLNKEENEVRLKLFGLFRGYKQNRELFENFPHEVIWYRASFNPDELLKVKYIDYSYWNVLSNHTRQPTAAVPNILSGITVFDQNTEGFLHMAEALRNGAAFPELILVTDHRQKEFVVLEGHARLTAYALAPECIPPHIHVIIGSSSNMKAWDNLFSS